MTLAEVVRRGFWWGLYIAAIERRQALDRKIASLRAELAHDESEEA